DQEDHRQHGQGPVQPRQVPLDGEEVAGPAEDRQGEGGDHRERGDRQHQGGPVGGPPEQDEGQVRRGPHRVTPTAASSSRVTRPSSSRSTRSQRAPTAGSWVTTTRVRPCPTVDSRRASITWAEVRESSAPVGSSAKTTSGSVTCARATARSEEHTSELQSREKLVCRLLLEKKKTNRLPQ